MTESQTDQGNLDHGPDMTDEQLSKSQAKESANQLKKGVSKATDGQPSQTSTVSFGNLPPTPSELRTTDKQPRKIRKKQGAIGSLISSSMGLVNDINRTMHKSVNVVHENIKYHMKDYSKYDHIERPKKWWEFMLLFSILVGIEFIHAVEAIFVNPILLAIGIPATFATMIWSFSPILGLLTVPVLGSLSDKCGSRLGRRRPFILYFSCGMIIGLILLGFGPNFSVMLGDAELKDVKHSGGTTATVPEAGNNQTSTLSALSSLGSTLASQLSVTENGSASNPKKGSVVIQGGNKDITNYQTSYKYLLIFICVGVIIMDYSADSGSSPAMSYMLDITLSEQHTRGLTIGTAMTATGGLLGYLIGSLDWEHIWPSRVLRNQFQIVFIIALGLFIVMAILTLTSFKEKPLYKLKVSRAEYAQRMSIISHSPFYASDRSFKRRYSAPRGHSKSISFGLEHTGLLDSLTLWPNVPNGGAPGGITRAIDKFRQERMSLPDLRNKTAPRKSIIAHFLDSYRKEPEKNGNATVFNNTVESANVAEKVSQPHDKLALPQKHVFLEVPKIIITDDGGDSSNQSSIKGRNRKESKSSLKTATNPGTSRASSPNKSRNPSILRGHHPSITDIMAKSKFQDLNLNRELDEIRQSHTPKHLKFEPEDTADHRNRLSPSEIKRKISPRITLEKVSEKLKKHQAHPKSELLAPKIQIADQALEEQDEEDNAEKELSNTLDNTIHGLNGHVNKAFFPESQINTHRLIKRTSSLTDLNKKSHLQQDHGPSLAKAEEASPFESAEVAAISMCREQNEIEDKTRLPIERGNSGDIKNDTEEEEEMSLKDYLMSIVHLPRIMGVLCLTHLLCWMAFLCFASYFSDFVGQSVYKGNPTSSPGSRENILYEQGVRFSSVGMFLYALTCLLYSTRIKRFGQRIGTKRVYMFGMSYYCVCMAVLGFAPYKAAVIILSPAAGIMQATLLSIPFIFVTAYHDKNFFDRIRQKKYRNHWWQFWRKQIKSSAPNTSDLEIQDHRSSYGTQAEELSAVDSNTNPKKKRRRRGLGTDVAIVSSMVFWAQLIVSLTIGRLIDAFNSTLVVPFYGCILAIIAVLMSLGITSFD